MLFLFPVKYGKLSTGVSAQRFLSCRICNFHANCYDYNRIARHRKFTKYRIKLDLDKYVCVWLADICNGEDVERTVDPRRVPAVHTAHVLVRLRRTVARLAVITPLCSSSASVVNDVASSVTQLYVYGRESLAAFLYAPIIGPVFDLSLIHI